MYYSSLNEYSAILNPTQSVMRLSFPDHIVGPDVRYGDLSYGPKLILFCIRDR